MNELGVILLAFIFGCSLTKEEKEEFLLKHATERQIDEIISKVKEVGIIDEKLLNETISQLEKIKEKIKVTEQLRIQRDLIQLEDFNLRMELREKEMKLREDFIKKMKGGKL